MRWMIRFAVCYSCLLAVAWGAEPTGPAIRNPYAVGPTATHSAPLNAWRSTAPSTSPTEPVTSDAAAQPVARSLPNDCLKALRAAVAVRTPAEAYRAAEQTPGSQAVGGMRAAGQPGTLRRDEAVKPAAWIESASAQRESVASPAAETPRLLSDVTAAHQGATRLTRNPYRNAATTGAAASENPLR